MIHRLEIDKNGLELGTRGDWAFPVAGGFKTANILDYEGERFECHFHAETELTLVEAGEMYYQANDRVELLREGDAVFVNCNVIHAGWQCNGADCWYSPLNFSTVMVSGHENSLIEQRFVRPLLEERLLPMLFLHRDRAEDAPLLAVVDEIYRVRREKKEGRELLLKAALCRFWYQIYQIARQRESVLPDRGTTAVKAAIRFMEEHYTEHLTLARLSATCGLSRSEFCRTFHRLTGRTPFHYLQHLRVRRSLPLLEKGELSVTEIASRVGFSGGSYYAEIFRRFVGTSPLDYRRQNK